jgi:hypothetical protein
MGWAAGVFTRVHDWSTDDGADIDILSVRMDAEDDNFAAGINATLTKDGSNSPSADLPMATYKHLNVGEGSARNHYAAISQLQDAGVVYGTSGGAANVQTLSFTPAITAYAAGQRFFFKAGFTNTGAMTMNINGVGAKNVYLGNAALSGNEVIVNNVYLIVYDGTQFQLVGAINRYVGMSIKSGGQSASSGSPEIIDFTGATPEWETDDMWEGVTNPTRITIPTGLGGKWRFLYQMAFGFHATGYRDIFLKKNGSYMSPAATGDVTVNAVTASSKPTYIRTALDIALVDDDYIELGARQNSGGSLTVTGWLEVQRLGS